MDYLANLLVTWIALGVTAAALGFFSGRSGYLSLLQAGLFGVGAYANALIIHAFPGSAGVSWVTAGLFTGLFAGLLTFPLFRTRSDHFVILTLVLQIGLTLVLLNWDAVTRGPLGISYESRWPFGLGPAVDLAVMASVGSAALVLLVVVSQSRTSVLLGGIRDSESLMASFGYDVPKIKALSFSFSALIAGVCGAAYGQYIGFIDPTSYRLEESILLLAIIILAGTGGIIPCLTAALFLVALPEAMRFLSLSSTYDANIREIVYGVALLAVIVLRTRRTTPIH